MNKIRFHIGKIDTDVKSWSTEHISHVVLYSLTALTAVVFLLFYFVGYDNPAVWDERYVAPLLTDLLMVLMLLFLLGAIAVACYSKWHSVRANHTPAIVNGIPGKRITILVTVGTVVLMALLYALPSDEIYVNGQKFTEQIWLRMASMFVIASVLLILIGVGAIIFGIVRNRRRR